MRGESAPKNISHSLNLNALNDGFTSDYYSFHNNEKRNRNYKIETQLYISSYISVLTTETITLDLKTLTFCFNNFLFFELQNIYEC